MYRPLLGYLSIAVAEFVAALGLIPGSAVRFLSVLILVSIVALQWLGIRISSQFQEVDHLAEMRCVLGSCFGLVSLVLTQRTPYRHTSRHR